jgi:serine/threonine-protein kinase HipA
MALRGAQKHYRIVDIHRRHFDETARLCDPGMNMDAVIDDIVESTPRVIDDVGGRLPRGFPMGVFDVVTSNAAKAAVALRRRARAR